MFKKLVTIFLLIGSVSVHSETQNPFKLETTMKDVLGYSIQYYNFYVLKDSVVITDVILNKGKCIMVKAQFPLVLNQGEKYTTNEGGCNPIVEIEIKTANSGEWVWK